MPLNASSDITIIVPTCNRPDLLRMCLDSIRVQTCQPSMVMVMDQSDNEDSYYLCKEYDVLFHHCLYKNKSKAINEAISSSKTSWVAIIDDDTLLASDWVEIITRKRKAYSDIRIIQGNIYSTNGYKDINEDIHPKEKIVRKRWVTPLFLIGCNFAFSRDLYGIVGPFNEDLGPGTHNKGGEDIEWGYRVFALQNPLLICPDLRLVHQAWRNNSDIIIQMSNYGKAMAAVLKTIGQKSIVDYSYYYIHLSIRMISDIVIAFISGSQKEIMAYLSYRNSFVNAFRNG